MSEIRMQITKTGEDNYHVFANENFIHIEEDVDGPKLMGMTSLRCGSAAHSQYWTSGVPDDVLSRRAGQVTDQILRFCEQREADVVVLGVRAAWAVGNCYPLYRALPI